AAAPPSAPPRAGKDSPPPPSPAVPPEPFERPSALGNGVARTSWEKGLDQAQPVSGPGTTCSFGPSGAATWRVEFAAGSPVAPRVPPGRAPPSSGNCPADAAADKPPTADAARDWGSAGSCSSRGAAQACPASDSAQMPTSMPRDSETGNRDSRTSKL